MVCKPFWVSGVRSDKAYKRHIAGDQRLWDPPGYGDLLPIPGAGDIGGGRQLADGGQEFVKGKGGVEEEDENNQQGGIGAAGVWLFL